MLALDGAAADRGLVPKDLDDLIGSNLEIQSAPCGLELDIRDHAPFQAQGGITDRFGLSDLLRRERGSSKFF